MKGYEKVTALNISGSNINYDMHRYTLHQRSNSRIKTEMDEMMYLL